MSMNIILMGYYGFKNIGEDLFFHQLINYCSQKEYIKHIFVFRQNNYYGINNNQVDWVSNSVTQP